MAAEIRRVSVSVVTGFLGSGKTTLINNVLKQDHGLKIAIIENEFGEVGIDDALVFNTDEEVVELNNGCICCTVRGDLVRILTKLLARKTRLDAIIIETTGLADPAPVAQTFFVDPVMRRHLKLDAIITVVDAKFIGHHLDDVEPEGVENEAVEQLAFADILLLNKLDLVTAEEKATAVGRIKGINAQVAILECQNAEVDASKLLSIDAFSLESVLSIEPRFLEDEGADHQHDTTVTSVGIELEGQLDMGKLNDWLSDLLTGKGADLFRSKGVLCIAGSPHKYVFQGVHMLLQMGSSQDGMGRPWAPGEKRINRLVFIGRNLDRKELNDSFAACLVQPQAPARRRYRAA